ncbi:hypothetical protein GALL_427030 [mine drainage metagenome]|uniref:Uncharacterized protein n=1 Tax=mine drainage metagenome TaxID=410659 RepID=A0A1J5PX54_9ZZZZ
MIATAMMPFLPTKKENGSSTMPYVAARLRARTASPMMPPAKATPSTKAMPLNCFMPKTVPMNGSRSGTKPVEIN